MNQSKKKKPACSAAGKEIITLYRVVWLKGQRRTYMQAQIHAQWTLLKTNGKFKNDSNLPAYLISLEFRRQER